MAKEYFRAHVAVFLVLRRGEEVLLHLRKGGYAAGSFGLVAGHIDGNERMAEALARETKEEADISIRPEDLRTVHVMHRYCPDREYVDVFLEADAWKGELRNNEPEKCGGLEWFSEDALPDNMVPEIRQALQQVRKGVPFGEFGWEKARIAV